MMTHESTRAGLDDYLDDEVEAPARAEMDQHLAACADCRAALQKLRTRRAKVGSLAQKLEPGRDLWPDIARRIDTEQPGVRRAVTARRWALAGALAAAAVAVLMIRSGGVPSQVPSQVPSAMAVASAPEVPASAPPVAAISGETDYLHATAALMTEFAEIRGSMAPETAAVFDENLRIVDSAIDAWRRAVLITPDDPEVRASLDQAYEDKLELLRTATELRI